ncbi:MAG: hypothetical protein AVDCRST_MAG64-1776, partial [uncultured Phycisphaerae bacterium]
CRAAAAAVACDLPPFRRPRTVGRGGTGIAREPHTIVRAAPGPRSG